MRPRAVADDDPEEGHFLLFSWHFSGSDRKRHDVRRCNYMPLNLGEVPDYYRRFLDPVDIVILKTRPIDKDGYFNFSAANTWHHAVIERTKLVIVEVSRSLPYVFGEDNGVHVSEGWESTLLGVLAYGAFMANIESSVDGEEAGRPVKTASVHVRLVENSLAAR
jgi:acyl-CoA hydrolase